MKNICSLLFGFLLALAWWWPDHFMPYTSYYSEWIAFVAFVVLFIGHIKQVLMYSWLSLVILAVVCLVIVQYVLGVYSFLSDAFLAWVYLLAALLAYQLGLSLKNRIEMIQMIAGVIVLGGLGTALICMCQWFGSASVWIFSLPNQVAIGNLAQPNQSATLMAWALLALGYLWVSVTFSQITFLLLSSLLVFGIAITESRTPVVQLLCVATWMSFFYLKNVINRKQLTLLLTPCILFGAAYFLVPSLKEVIFFQESVFVRLVSGEYSSRLAIWSSLLQSIVDAPIYGYGFGQASTLQAQHVLDFGRTVEFTDYSHNLILDIWLWCGPFFGLLLLGFWVGWLGKSCWVAKSIEDWFLMGCVGVLLVHSMLEYPFAYSYFLLPGMLMLGLADNGTDRAKKLFNHSGIYVACVSVISITLLVLFFKEYKSVSEDDRLMRAQNLKMQVEKNLRLTDKVVLLDAYREYLKFARTKASPGISAQALRSMKCVAYRFPHSVLLYRYGLALALNGHEEEGRNELKKIEYFSNKKWYNYYMAAFEKNLAAGYEE